MDFNLNKEQELLRDGLGKFLATRYDLEKSRTAAKLGPGWQPEIWRGFAEELGILGAAFPESAGGIGGGPVEIMVIAEELGRALAIEPFIDTVVVAGGMESMSNAPHMIPNSRTGNRYGGFQAVDHMAWDGLTNPYDGQSMGVFAEKTVEKYGFTREEQDAYAIESVQRAQAAVASGAFADEIVPVKVATRKGEVEIATDEQPGKSDIAKIPPLRPAFKKDGTVTAASSSSISDGAAATVVLSADEAARRGLQPLARIVGHATFSHQPEWFTTAPVGAISNLLDKVGWSVGDVDLFEINEAFAVVAMAPIRDLPLFPLGIVLYPRERLPLHIFEPRYKEMIRHCLESEQRFGVVLFDEGKIAEVGCLASIYRIVNQ